MEGKDGRTEKATPKKRREERKKGNLSMSTEVVSMAVLLLGVVALRFAIPGMLRKLTWLLSYATEFDATGDFNVDKSAALFHVLCILTAGMLAPVVVPVMAAAVIGNMAQTGPYFSTETLKWKFSSLNPVKGLKKLFSINSVVQLATSLLKVALIAGVVSVVVRREIPVIGALHGSLSSALCVRWVFLLLFRITIIVTAIFTVIAFLDWCYRKYKHEKGIMMSKQEVKEERKQEEPNPHVKRAQIKKMREFTLMRMMEAVPKADVIITNPTHVAVALEYDSETMDAPKVTAKGMRLMAERIKKVARENNVPIVERPALARSLNKHVKLGHEVPSMFYAAVAQVLAYLFKIGKGKREELAAPRQENSSGGMQ